MVQGLISVIIPAYNAAGTLRRCLEAVRAQEDDHFEIIVVDDGSTDGTAAICADHGVAHIVNPQRMGPAISRNRGADVSKGSILAFTDADCVPPTDWLRDIRKWLEVAPVVCGTYHPAPWQNALGRFANLDWHLYWFRFIPAETDSFSMGNVAFRREVFFDRERLEEHFFKRIAAAEDTVLAMTIAERHRILSTGQLWVLHMHRDRLWDYVRKHITTGFSRTLLSLAFPRRKVFGARDINLGYVLPQLLVTASVGLGLAATGAGAHPGWLAGALVAFGALQLPSLAYIWRKEGSAPFVLMSTGLLAIRNTAWLLGVVRALAYALTIPPELRAAAAWRKRRRAGAVGPVEVPSEGAETTDASSQEPAKARARAGSPG
jgi:glycosyltransferase involved in cell wall biosynthesis